MAAIWISPIPVKEESGAVTSATIMRRDGVGKKGMMFPAMLAKKTSRSGFPLKKDTAQSMGQMKASGVSAQGEWA